jgi:3-dehydroquinate dehydratase
LPRGDGNPDGPGTVGDKEQADMAERCWKCASAIGWNAAIGAFCTNPECDVLDALDSAETFEVRILIEPAAAAVPQGVPAPALVAYRALERQA